MGLSAYHRQYLRLSCDDVLTHLTCLTAKDAFRLPPTQQIKMKNKNSRA